MAKRTATTTSTRPTATAATPATPSRASRAAKAAATAAPAPRAPRRSITVDGDNDLMPLTRADETRIQREQQALERGEAMTPDRKLDRDLAHLADHGVGRRVPSRRRREPEEIGIIYRGRRKGLLHDGAVSINVPDEENDEVVAALQDTIPGMDENTQRRVWQKQAALRGEEPKPYVPLRDRLVVRGPSYQFTRNETTLVHQDDADYILAHKDLVFERVGGDDNDGDVFPTGRRGAPSSRQRSA